MQNSIISLKKQYEVADYNAKPRNALSDTLNYLQNVSKMSSLLVYAYKKNKLFADWHARDQYKKTARII